MEERRFQGCVNRVSLVTRVRKARSSTVVKQYQTRRVARRDGDFGVPESPLSLALPVACGLELAHVPSFCCSRCPGNVLELRFRGPNHHS
jgi:hypothetical protein